MDTRLELAPLLHPDPRITRAGFELHSPYFEQCWGAVLGPSGVMMLRRLPVLWRQETPAVVDVEQFARSVGVGAPHGSHSRFNHTIDRVCQFGLARWTEQGSRLGVYTHVPPVSDRLLSRLPEWTRRAHDELLADHLDRLAGLERPDAEVVGIAPRLDRLEQRTTTRPTTRHTSLER